MSENDMKPTPGANGDADLSSVNDREDEGLEDENLDNGGDDDGEDDDQDGNNQDNQQKKPIDRKQKFHSTVTAQNRTISEMKRELADIKNSKNLSDEDLAKIKEKYSEDDLDVIEKIIEKKANEMMDKRQSTSLAQREMNIFLKEHPELSDPELRHIKSLQKDYGYSLRKAYSVLFGKSQSGDQKQTHRVSDSFGGDSNKLSSSKTDATKKADDKARNDMDAFLGSK